MLYAFRNSDGVGTALVFKQNIIANHNIFIRFRGKPRGAFKSRNADGPKLVTEFYICE